MKILICDDDSKIINKINSLLNKVTKQRKLHFEIKTYNCGESVLSDLERYDIAFVDIEMSGINGLSVTKHLQKTNPNIIVFIVTSFQAYLDDAMDLNVFRYLSKPLDENRFIKNLNIAINVYQKSTQIIATEAYDEFYSIFTRDILYITIKNRKACIITKDNTYPTKRSFEYWKKELSNYDYFVQSHCSYIINLKNVTHFSKTDVTLSKNQTDTITLPISRRFYPLFKEAFKNYIGVTV